MKPLWVVDLGRMGYDPVHALQEAAVAARAEGRVSDILFLVEHLPVYTMGRSAREEHLLVSPEELAARGAIVRRIARGGDITYHGPGQLVGYPILDLNDYGRDLHRYLRTLEQSLIGALAELGIEGSRVPRLTGVWVGDHKIAAIGVAVRRWATYHGFALNVAVELERFAAIVPCGIHDRGVTSMHEFGEPPPLRSVGDVVVRHLAGCFGVDAQWVGVGDLERVLKRTAAPEALFPAPASEPER